jgi:myo-inositol 2-dehydrogenase/D-chiro-inositol 1-dehydrogenase
MPPNQALSLDQEFPSSLLHHLENNKIRVAVLGCGMMGQEHISYISGYPNLRIDFLCDPHEPSLAKACKVIRAFNTQKQEKDQDQDNELEFVRCDESNTETYAHAPQLFLDEDELMEYVHLIDLLVIASPNYLHTPSLLKWAQHDINILVEKPVAVSQAQLELLHSLNETQAARIWVAMEYRYIPAIAKLRQLLPHIGDIKMITIRENRYPFLTKIGDWNRDTHKTGDTLVEKCCHFWDLFRLLTGLEIDTTKLRSMVQRGLNYQDETNVREHPIIDSAYVVLPFLDSPSAGAKHHHQTIGCLELCMYAEGSRHQEEIIVTGTKVSTTHGPDLCEHHGLIAQH